MELTLQSEEAKVFKRILTDYLSDLRMEVGRTEDYELREELKQDESMIKSMISRLTEAGVPSA